MNHPGSDAFHLTIHRFPYHPRKTERHLWTQVHLVDRLHILHHFFCGMWSSADLDPTCGFPRISGNRRRRLHIMLDHLCRADTRGEIRQVQCFNVPGVCTFVVSWSAAWRHHQRSWLMEMGLSAQVSTRFHLLSGSFRWHR